MDGTVLVQSVLGAGSSFTIDLPFTPGERTDVSQSDQKISLKSAFLLVVEDNPLAQSMLRSILQSRVRRLEFARGIDSVGALELAGFDRIMVDGACLMKRHADDPIGAVGQLARMTDAPITALWPSPTPEDLMRLKEVGADQVLSKPITPADLVSALERAFENPQMAPEMQNAVA